MSQNLCLVWPLVVTAGSVLRCRWRAWIPPSGPSKHALEEAPPCHGPHSAACRWFHFLSVMMTCRFGLAVAQFALTQYLEVLGRAEGWFTDGAVFMTPQGIAYDRLLAYARLSRAYEREGRPAEAEEAIARALDCARQHPKLTTFTNLAMLTELVRRMDDRGRH